MFIKFRLSLLTQQESGVIAGWLNLEEAVGFTLQESDNNSNHQKVVVHMVNGFNAAVMEDTPKNCGVILKILEKMVVKMPLIDVNEIAKSKAKDGTYEVTV